MLLAEEENMCVSCWGSFTGSCKRLCNRGDDVGRNTEFNKIKDKFGKMGDGVKE